MTRKLTTIVSLCLVLLVGGWAGAAELEAHIDRNRLSVGESLQLTLRLHDSNGAPDLTPLEDDFAVLGVSQGMRTQIINGQRSSSRDWQLTLAPLHAGTLEIPALEAGSARSLPLTVQVLDPGRLTQSNSAGSNSVGSNAAGSPVLLEAEVDEHTPYVQGKVGLTLRVWMDERVQRGSLSEPSVDGAAIERVGEDRNYNATRGGHPYQVVERQYALFPQRSGELVIPPVVFDGSVRDPSRRARRGDPFDRFFGGSAFDDFFGGGFGPPGGMFGGSMLDELMGRGGQPVRTASAPLTLDVQPRPEAAGNDWWLPARHVELVEEWDGGTPTFRVGDVVNRTVAIRATGLSGSQLPAIELPPIEGMKQYAEPAVDDTATRGDEVVSIKLQKAALVPTKAGKLTLPAIEVAWWDTEHDESRTASLPAREVDVLPAAGQTLAASPAAAATPPQSATPPSEPAPEQTALIEPISDATHAKWVVGASIVFCLLMAGLLVRGFARRPSPAPSFTAPKRGGATSAASFETQLRRACDANDAGAALAALAQIARARWPLAPPSGASGWGARLDAPALEAAIRRAEQARYAADAQVWKGSDLWQAYRSNAKGGSGAREKAGVLPDLYPTLRADAG